MFGLCLSLKKLGQTVACSFWIGTTDITATKMPMPTQREWIEHMVEERLAKALDSLGIGGAKLTKASQGSGCVCESASG